MASNFKQNVKRKLQNDGNSRRPNKRMKMNNDMYSTIRLISTDTNIQRSDSLHEYRNNIINNKQNKSNAKFTILSNNDYTSDNYQNQLFLIKQYLDLNGMYCTEHGIENSLIFLNNKTKKLNEIIRLQRIRKHKRIQSLNGECGVKALINIPKHAIIGQYIGTQLFQNEYNNFNVNPYVQQFELHNKFAFKTKLPQTNKSMIIDALHHSLNSKEDCLINMINDCRENIKHWKPTEMDNKYHNIDFIHVLVNDWPIIFVITRRDISCGEELMALYNAGCVPNSGVIVMEQNGLQVVGGKQQYIKSDRSIAYIMDDVKICSTSKWIERCFKSNFEEFNEKYNQHMDANEHKNDANEHKNVSDEIYYGTMTNLRRFPFTMTKPSYKIAHFDNNILSPKEHNHLKHYLNEYQKCDKDIGIKRRDSSIGSWNIYGLVDPDKHLSSFSHIFDKKYSDRSYNFHKWIPSIFYVNKDKTECKLLSEIANLNPYLYTNTIYKSLTNLFLKMVPKFELITEYNLSQVPLRVIVKIQDLHILNNSDKYNYRGPIHKDGLYENIIGVGLYYYDISDNINGGELKLYAVNTMPERAYMDEIEINIKERSCVVLQNELCFHRVCKVNINNNIDTDNTSGNRKIISFALIGPDPVYTRNVVQSKIHANSIVVNWMYHSRHIITKALEQFNLNRMDCTWLIGAICEFVVGDKQFIEQMRHKYNICRSGYQEITASDETDLTRPRKLLGNKD